MLRQAKAFSMLGDKISTKLLLKRVVKNYPKSSEAQIARKRLKALEYKFESRNTKSLLAIFTGITGVSRQRYVVSCKRRITTGNTRLTLYYSMYEAKSSASINTPKFNKL